MTTILTQARPERASPLFDWLSYLGSLHVSAIDMGLSRVLPVAIELGILDVNNTSAVEKRSYVFTVAGTNGKGSTTATIAKLCELAGYKTALYQSPHVFSFTERVKINDTEVTEQQLIDAFIAVDDARLKCKLSLSFFEMTTLAAMLIFKQADCDVWVLEIGLGGRLDVVNIIDPDVAVITNIGVDHVDWLGDDINKIGFEKAGILRKGIPCVLGSDDLPDTVYARANELSCYVTQFNKDYAWQQVDDAEWIYSSPSVTMTLPRPTLALENVSTAVTAVSVSDLEVEQAHIQSAMLETKLIGRFQVEQKVNQTIVYDAAHNPDGVQFLLRNFLPLYRNKLKLAETNESELALHIVFSMLADKDMVAVIQALSAALPQASWHIAPLTVIRAASAAQLEDAFSQADCLQNKTILHKKYENLAAAMAGVTLSAGKNKHQLVLVCGSFHTIADAMTKSVE